MLGAIIGGAASLVSSLIGMKASSDANQSSIEQQKLANQGNIDLANANNNFNLEMWQRNNEYNSPESQISRYKAAGLNPALIYGTSGNAGNSSSPITGTVARINALPARDLTGVANYLSQGLQNMVNLAGQLEDIKSKKLNNSILAYKEKFSDRLLQAGLDQIVLNNQYNRNTLDSRVNSAYWRSLFDASIANEKQNYVNDWQAKMLQQAYDLGAARLNNIESSTNVNSWKTKVMKQQYDEFERNLSLFARRREYEMNNVNFADSNVWRGIDKGMSILGALLDNLTLGKKLFGRFPRLKTRESNSYGGSTTTDYIYE